MAEYLAYCSVSKQYYQVICGQNARAVTDFLPCKPPAPMSVSPVTEVLETDPSLCPCPRCGQRMVGGCGCAPKYLPCEPYVGFRFYCVYCSQLQLYSPRSRRSR